MKTRVISAIVALAICIPLIIIGGMYFNLAVYIISIFALREFLSIKETKKQLPPFIKLISYLFITFLILVDVGSINIAYALDYRVLAAAFMLFLIPTVLYHDRKKYSVTDAFYLIGGTLFLGISMALLIMVRHISLNYLIFLLLITIITDTFAYIAGSLIGKHKLLPEISPKKSWEGAIIGSLMAMFVASMFYHTVIDPSFSKIALLLITCFLSVLGQLGDLVFSAIKRYYGKKDFSNIMPGHGGLLDRLDSIIFVLLGFTFFIAIL